MKYKTVTQWTRELADSDYKYGGGSAASVVGALAANLAEYVFGFQQHKQKYADQKEDITKAMARAKKLSEDLLDLAEIDADAFAPVLPLYQLPKETEEERAYRQEQIDQGLADAARPPLAIMEKMDDVMHLFEQLVQMEVTGSIVHDITVGLIFVEAVIESAKINCDVNTKAIHNDKQRTQMAREVNDSYHRLLERCHTLKAAATRHTR